MRPSTSDRSAPLARAPAAGPLRQPPLRPPPQFPPPRPPPSPRPPSLRRPVLARARRCPRPWQTHSTSSRAGGTPTAHRWRAWTRRRLIAAHSHHLRELRRADRRIQASRHRAARPRVNCGASAPAVAAARRLRCEDRLPGCDESEPRRPSPPAGWCRPSRAARCDSGRWHLESRTPAPSSCTGRRRDARPRRSARSCRRAAVRNGCRTASAQTYTSRPTRRPRSNRMPAARGRTPEAGVGSSGSWHATSGPRPG